MLLQNLILCPGGALQLRQEFAQTLLALLHAAALSLRVEFLRCNVGHELVQPAFQARPLLFELYLLGRKLLQAHHIALLLQIQ